ncbi:MAG: DUF1552 domain-containing protein [Verrucomicrobiales bacterium]|nr:DUF1552 domain-containing protein [Verrucomicrobiales bacterium]
MKGLPSSLYQSQVDRRLFLRSAVATIALPSLEAFSEDSVGEKGSQARNFVAIGAYLGWHQNAFYPAEAGSGYSMPRTLEPISDYRDQFTVFSGLDHRAPNGHKAWINFLSGKAPGTYSLDQQVADRIGGESRFASIELATGVGEGAKTMSFTKQGVGLPTIMRPSVLYRRLFVSQAERERAEYLIESGKSSLDSVLEDAKRFQAGLPKRDREKLNEYFDSFRAVEKRMDRQLSSLDDPVPETGYQLPSYDPITPNLQMEAGRIMYDLMVLALDSGSTRVLSLFLDGLGQVFSINGEVLKAGYHALSHHGNDPEMIEDLIAIERAHIDCFAGFLKQLSEKRNPQGKSLLDDTVILLGTGMGDASRHSNANLPTLVAGGGFQHGRHVAVDRAKPDAPLLGDLYLTLMNRLGIEQENFSNATRNLNQVFS